MPRGPKDRILAGNPANAKNDRNGPQWPSQVLKSANAFKIAFKSPFPPPLFSPPPSSFIPQLRGVWGRSPQFFLEAFTKHLLLFCFSLFLFSSFSPLLSSPPPSPPFFFLFPPFPLSPSPPSFLFSPSPFSFLFPPFFSLSFYSLFSPFFSLFSPLTRVVCKNDVQIFPLLPFFFSFFFSLPFPPFPFSRIPGARRFLDREIQQL